MVNTAPLPLPEWTPAQRIMQDYEPSTSGASAYSNDTGAEVEKDFLEPTRPTTASPFQRTCSLSSAAHWRRRPKSLVFSAEDIPAQTTSHEDAIEEETRPESQGEGNRPGASLKGKFRRASLSLMKGIVHRRDRRSSEPEKSLEDQQQIEQRQQQQQQHPARPSTAHSAWNKLRQAASFRPSRMAHGGRSNCLDTIYSPLESSFPSALVPGNGLEPPIIPSHTGAAAKASAAYQNEYLAMVQREEWLAENMQNDRESGIGISLLNADDAELAANQSSRMNKVDFVAELPSELAIQILSHLDATCLNSAAGVSKQWYALVQDQQVWRQSFLREMATTYATTEPIQPGTGFGVPAIRPGNDWQKIYRTRQLLDQSWKEGTSTRPIYLNGHLDSIYCLQFDEYVQIHNHLLFVH